MSSFMSKLGILSAGDYDPLVFHASTPIRPLHTCSCLHVCTHARTHVRVCVNAKSLMLRSDDALTHGVSRCSCIIKPWDQPTPEASDGGIHGQDGELAGEDVCA